MKANPLKDSAIGRPTDAQRQADIFCKKANGNVLQQTSALSRTASYCNALQGTDLHLTVLHSTALRRTALQGTSTMRRNFLLLMVLFLSTVSSTVRADKKDDYKQFAEQTRKEVWALPLPDFEQTAVPAQYTDRSAVILAAHSRLEVTKKTRVSIGSFLLHSGITNREVNCRNLYRELVAIQDKAALEKYSEFDFKAETKHDQWQYDELTKHVLGIRIIKPDGTTKVVDTDEFVIATEGKKGDEQRQKLAVPGLEIGDKIDIFFFTYTSLENHNLPPFTFSFRQPYPMLRYTVHCEIDRGLTAQYRCLNGAPDFRRTTNEDKDIILDTEATDVSEAEPALWYNPVRQTPYIRLHVINSKMKYGYIPESAKKNVGLQANPDVNAIIKDNWNDWIGIGNSFCGMSTMQMLKLRKQLKALKKAKLTDEQKADSIYTKLVMNIESNPYGNYNRWNFVGNLAHLLDFCKIPFQRIISVRNDEKESMKERIDAYFPMRGVRLKEGGKFYTGPSEHYNMLSAWDIPAEVQGEPASVEVELWKKKNFTFETIPVSPIDDNRNLTTLQVGFNGTETAIARTETRTGILKETWQRHLVKQADRFAVSRRYLGITTPVEEEVSGKERADFTEALRKEAEKEKDNYRDEIEFYHGEKPKEVKSYRMQSIGLLPESQSLTYDVNYTMDGWMKKAGANYLFSAGKLIGEQLKVEGKERQRTADIHSSAPRSLEWDITVTLPSGYTVAPESLAKLQRRVENECGSFSAEASVQDGKLSIRAQKRYLHAQEPASRWNKLLEIIDAACAYEKESVVLKRK